MKLAWSLSGAGGVCRLAVNMKFLSAENFALLWENGVSLKC
jgi:hypothetical protein